MSGVSYWLVIAINVAPAELAASATLSVEEVRPVELMAITTSSRLSSRIAIIADS
ncbi:Uncharacterised protein [Mycobacteroides abscessus subsp. abscessus]|nr:Uncharacterised protein [Mycobacteroides abscessus subsp. abscessus]